MVKHLNSIEEQILESLAWTNNSALWEALHASANRVPSCEEVSQGQTKRISFVFRERVSLCSLGCYERCSTQVQARCVLALRGGNGRSPTHPKLSDYLQMMTIAKEKSVFPTGVSFVYQVHFRADPMPSSSWLTQNSLVFLQTVSFCFVLLVFYMFIFVFERACACVSVCLLFDLRKERS